MVCIELTNLGKRFNREIVFQQLNYTFKSGQAYALTGPNGSGKSTLLQVISGFTLPTDGSIIYTRDEQKLAPETLYQYLSIATPYMELIEEFTLQELLAFHFKFRKLKDGYTIRSIMETAYLYDARYKYIKHFSSGMKQRLKLALAFYTQSEIILLDEPTTNLDLQGIAWYEQQLSLLTSSLLIIASNQPKEYRMCQQVISVADYKQYNHHKDLE